MRLRRSLGAALAALALVSCSNGSHPPSTLNPPRSHRGMVSSASAEATAVGIDVLRRGGNAVDAAVAVGFALAVTLPQAGNLGGGGFMVIRMADGRSTTLDFRERAPAAATRDMYLDSAGEFVAERAQIGALAAGVPGSPAGLLTALDRFGTRPRAEILAPSIALARDGFVIHPQLAADLASKRSDFERYPSSSLFADTSLVAGARLRQSDLVRTLERIARDGADGFYAGETADLIVAEMKRSGGIITGADLAAYRAVERAPVVGHYRGHTIITMGPPSSGGVLLVQMLRMLELSGRSTPPFHSADHVHLLAETMRRAYADRAEFMGDPDFVDIPVAQLTSDAYAHVRAATIADTATPSAAISHGDPGDVRMESPETTHYSVVDSAGNCVSVTVTLNSSFGAKLVVGGAGFLLNNEMDDFSARPGVPNLYGLVGGEANAIVPGKRMLSSMTPTIVLRDDRPWLVVGTPGGSTIITTVLQIINNTIDYGMPLPEAIEARRVHHQWLPDQIYYEAGALSPGAVDSLRQRGHTLAPRAETSGRVDAIMIEDGVMIGWSDRRGYGTAAGVEE
jgi:gamma-glutamyltranspeptidase / glutathione hydrolase